MKSSIRNIATANNGDSQYSFNLFKELVQSQQSMSKLGSESKNNPAGYSSADKPEESGCSIQESECSSGTSIKQRSAE